MIRDLDVDTEVVVSSVVRDESGLAFAARNYFLTADQKKAAAVIYRGLRAAELAVQAGETQSKKLVKQITQVLESEPGAVIDYTVIVDPERLEPVARLQGPTLIAVGVRIGNTSLNDSILIGSATAANSR